MSSLGVVAAGHQTSAEYGAAVLADGGNAVDAALGAMLASFVCEPVLTGLGAGGYMLVAGPGIEPVVLDFFVDAPGRGGGQPAAMVAVEVSFGDAVQTFMVGSPSVSVYGVPAGIAEAHRRFGSVPLAELTAPAAALARTGVPLAEKHAYILEIVAGVATLTEHTRALYAPTGRLLRAGETLRDPALADALDLFGRFGAEPFYTGSVGAAICEWVGEHGGVLSLADLAAYEVVARDPVRVGFRGREVLTNPPSSAGGVLLARTLQALDRVGPPVGAGDLVAAMVAAQELRTPSFLAGLGEEGFVERFMAGGRGPLGSTTHVSVLDASGMACSVTTSNGSSSGVVVPGTGIHLNNMLGEQDLNPLGFGGYEPGRRLASMMSPTAVLDAGGLPELVLGSAGSSRIRSAILQTILRVLDDGMSAPEAVLAPRLHYEDGTVFAEPGVSLDGLDLVGGPYELARFHEQNLFFGGVQAVQRVADGSFTGGGDPRRGGAAVVVS